MSSKRNLTAAQKEAYARVSQSLVTIYALEFRHSVFVDPIRIVQSKDNITCVLGANAPANAGESVTFSGFAFQTDEMAVTTEPDNAVRIKLDGIPGIFQQAFSQACETNEPIEVTIRPVLYDVIAKGNGTIQASYHMEVRDISSNMTTVVVRCAFSNPANKAFPNIIYSEHTNPSLV